MLGRTLGNMTGAPKTCKDCLFCVPREMTPGYEKPYCKVKGTWVSLSDKACGSAESKPRRRR